MKKQEILISKRLSQAPLNNQFFFTKSFPELGIWNNKRDLWEEGWTEGGIRNQNRVDIGFPCLPFCLLPSLRSLATQFPVSLFIDSRAVAERRSCVEDCFTC